MLDIVSNVHCRKKNSLAVKWIQILFRDETKPSKHRFGPYGQIRCTFLQVRLSVSTQVLSVTLNHRIKNPIIFLMDRIWPIL